MYAAALFKGMSPLFILFLGFAGTMSGTMYPWSWSAGRWHTWKRREHRAMLYVVLLFLLAIWIHLNVAGETSGRYFLPVVLAMSPFAALGLLACSRQLLVWAEGRHWNLGAGRPVLWVAWHRACRSCCSPRTRSATWA